MAPTDVDLRFLCDNDGPAPSFSGLNTLFFAASDQPTPDMVALAATTTNDGVTVISPVNDFGFFSVATVNVGSAGTVTVAARSNGQQPAGLFVCETNPANGTCLDPPAASVTATVGANGTPTFSVFVNHAEAIDFDPAGNRVFLDFTEGGALRGSTSVAFKSATSVDFFASDISQPIVQTYCINCHVPGGAAAATPLLLERTTNPDYLAANRTAFEDYLNETPGGAERILSKVQGALNHGGGAPVPAGTANFDGLTAFLELLGAEIGSQGPSPAALFDAVTMASFDRTLRRAALVLAGRTPSTAERALAVDEDGVRQALRGMMTGGGFHQFLLEGGNDRLLTDRQFLSQQTIDSNSGFFVDFTNIAYQLHVDAAASGNQDEVYEYLRRAQRGFARAPLELIAHVVENELPYTEILTADYVMANPYAAEGYGDQSVVFDDPDSVDEFRPAQIVSYYRNDQSKVTEFTQDFGTRVIDPGNLITDFPHAGILNTMAFLTRYPSTATNRNRARSRWTYYHFLGVDIEKSAPRTTDPDALADTNNPTMNNPACTVCHTVMDPVAGAFQNYGDEGNYRDGWQGLDSLAGHYKYPDDPDNNPTPYVYGDTWYRDMRTPGFDGLAAPDASNSLQWLAQAIVADDRFGVATVQFWWPALFGAPVLSAPEDESDADYEARLLAFNAQQLEIRRLADAFRGGINGGAAYNLKDLLVEMIMSAWFRAETIMTGDPLLLAALADAGVERMLTPEQLGRKTAALTGLQWGRGFDTWRDKEGHSLEREYLLYYGGIDSDGVTERVGDINATMAAVAQSHAMEMACPIVQRELYLLPDGERYLFSGVERSDSPISEFSSSVDVTAASWATRQTLSQTGDLTAGTGSVFVFFENDFYDETLGDRNLALDRLDIRNGAGASVFSLDFADLPEFPGATIGCGDRSYNEETGQNDYFNLWSSCLLVIPVTIPVGGSHTLDVVAWGQQAGPDPVRMSFGAVHGSAASGTSAGAMRIKNKLVTLFDVLLNETVTVDDPEVIRAYDLFVEVWQQYRTSDPNRERLWFDLPCHWWNDSRYFDGIVENARVINAEGYEEWDNALLDAQVWNVTDFSDGNYAARTWVAVVAYLLMDYRYLYL